MPPTTLNSEEPINLALNLARKDEAPASATELKRGLHP